MSNEGDPITSPEFQPPLTLDLFDIEKHRAYWGVMQRYSGAKYLAQILAPMAKSGSFNLEQELRKLAEHNDPQIREHFKHVPAYLRDLLVRASYDYIAGTGCYGQLVHELIAEEPHEVLFLVLNYDNLLERALSEYDKKFEFANLENYVASNREAKVVKLHGSINWYRLIGSPKNPWESCISSLDIFNRPPDNEIQVYDSQEYTANLVVTGLRVYPLLTAPLAGKGTMDMVCPSAHVKAAQEFLADCYKFLIIGTSGTDDDVMSLLNSSHPEVDAYAPYVHVVDISKDQAKTILDRFQNEVQAWRWLVTGSMTYGQGFKNYVSGNEMKDFAKYCHR
ncbi:MAG: SIR2 family protein [Chloroflexi bacterium]|nr:SIR2 family protein [Chloroflexota bacterium]